MPEFLSNAPRTGPIPSMVSIFSSAPIGSLRTLIGTGPVLTIARAGFFLTADDGVCGTVSAGGILLTRGSTSRFFGGGAVRRGATGIGGSRRLLARLTSRDRPYAVLRMIVQKPPFMIPLSRVAMEIPQMDNVVCGMPTYSYSS